jgi:hypothetical protein
VPVCQKKRLKAWRFLNVPKSWGWEVNPSHGGDATAQPLFFFFQARSLEYLSLSLSVACGLTGFEPGTSAHQALAFPTKELLVGFREITEAACFLH